MAEIGRLLRVRAIDLPADLFDDVAPKVVAGWRARAAVESPSHLRDHPEPFRLTLLAALLHGVPVATRAKVAPCGTPAGYGRHRSRGEDPCDRCRKANSDYLQAYRAGFVELIASAVVGRAVEQETRQALSHRGLLAD